MTEKILITSALLYENALMHFGHLAGAYLPADCYARFERLRGNDVHYVSGSDEYGVAITLSAELAGRTPKEHVDDYHAKNSRLFEKLNFSFDHYSRTSWEGHVAPVQRIFLDLLENGYVEAKDCEELYSEEDKRFLADRYVTGTCPSCSYEKARGDECPSCGASFEATDLKNPRSKMTNAPLVLKRTRHWFLKLDMMKERLKEWIATKKWKPNVVNFVNNYIDDLHERSITRDLSWGVPVPLEEAKGKVFYVWFDAPIGYISASMEWAKSQGDEELWKKYWLDEKSKLVHFVGKDNIPFHAVIFPAMCMGQNQPIKLVDELPANEFLNLEGRKFSKSEGWTIDIDDFLTKFSVDQLRYALAANAPETQDAEFTYKDFLQRCNGDLVGKYGNLINRTLTFIHKRIGKTPKQGSLDEADKSFLAEIERLTNDVANAYQNHKLRLATHLIMELAQTGNQYFDHKKPWVLAKDESKREELETVLHNCLLCIRSLGLISSPVMPESAQKVFEMLGEKRELAKCKWDELLAEPLIGDLQEPKLLFQKLEESVIEAEEEKLKKRVVEEPEVTYEPLKETISIDDVAKVDLRVGEILFAEKLPKSKKLLRVEVSLGFEKRQIVAGIATSYEPEALIGKKAVVVANLKPAKLMGVESQGMLLAGSDGKLLELPLIDKLPPGSKIS